MRLSLENLPMRIRDQVAKKLGEFAPKKHKYGAVKTEAGGYKFASKREANRYLELKMMEHAGLIADLELQPEFPIEIDEIPICVYKADYAYFFLETGVRVVEDVKGFQTAEYKLKKRLVEAVYKIRITEI